MNLIYFAAFIAACNAAKLDRTYLPPPSASLSGGSPGSLQAPLTRTFEQSQNVPPGGFINDREGVVVEAAIAGTRASNQQSGLGGIRNSYGSTDSKVGDAAFRTTSQKFSQAQQNVPNVAFGAHDESLNPDLSAFYQPAPAFRPGNIQIIRDYVSNTIKYQNDIDLDKFNYAFETDNGIKAAENGIAINGVKAQGGYSYTGDDGNVYSVSYTADEDGFRPHGSHLPTPPPIPAEILKSLEQNAKDEAAGLIDDGSYDAKKYNIDDDYTQSDANDRYNDRLSNKFGDRPGSDGGAFINQNQPAFVSSNFNGQFGFVNQASKNKAMGPDSSKFSGASRFIAMNNRNNVQSGQLTNVFGSGNEYLPPIRGQSGNIFSAGGNKNSPTGQTFTQQKIQSSFDKPQSAFVRPSSFGTFGNSQGTLTSQTSSLPSNSQNNQESISSFGFGQYNNPAISSQSNNKPSQNNLGTDTSFNRNPTSNQQETTLDFNSNKPASPQNSFNQSFASVFSVPSQPTQPSQQFLSTNSPLQSTQNLNGLSPTTQFNTASSGSFNPSQNNIAQTQYTIKPASSFATSFSSVVPTKQPQITLTTPLESSKTNEPTTYLDSSKTELSGVTLPDSTVTNGPASQFSFHSGQNKENSPTGSTSTLSGDSFSGFTTSPFNSNAQTIFQNFDNIQTTQHQNKEKSPTESTSNLNANTFSGFSSSPLNINSQTTSQNFDNTDMTELQNKEKSPAESTSTLSGNSFSGFSISSFNTNPQITSQNFDNTQTTQLPNKEKPRTESTSTQSGNTFTDFSSSFFNKNPQTTSQNFDNTQTTQLPNKAKPPTESTSTPSENTFTDFSSSLFNKNPQTTSQNFDNIQTTQLLNREKYPTDSTSTLSGNTFSGFSTPSFNTNPQTTSQNFDNTQTTHFLQSNKPQVTQAIFSSSRPGDSDFASNTQRPTYNTQSNQFTGQPQGADHSYIYNRPSMPFYTPFVLHQRNDFPNAPQSSQFGKVTQSMTTPLDSTISTDYQSQSSFNNSPKPTSTSPFSPSFTTLQKNDRNKNSFQASNGITQASISTFPSIMPTISANAKQPLSHFNLKPSQPSAFNTPSLSSFPPSSTLSIIPSAISDNQKNNAQSQSDQHPFNTEDKPNNELYEYNKPTQGLPSETSKDGVDLSPTERPQFTISSTLFNQESQTTTLEAQNNAQLDQQKPLTIFGQQPSLSVNQQSFLDSSKNVPTTQFTQEIVNTDKNTFTQFKKPGSESSNYEPSKFFPSTVSSDTFNTEKQDSQTYTATSLSQNPTFGLQTDTRFGSSDAKETTTSDFQQSNKQTETEFNNKPSTPIPGLFNTKPGFDEQTQYTQVSQSFSSKIPINQNVPFGLPPTQSGQGSFGNKIITAPQFQPSVTQFDYNPSTSILLQSQSSGSNTQNPDNQFDFSTSFVQSTNEPSKFDIQSNRKENQGSFDIKLTTTSLFQKPSQQISTTFNEPSTSIAITAETESPLGTTQFGEVYDYTNPSQGLLKPSQNNNNVQSQVNPQFGAQSIPQFGHLGQQIQQSHFNLQPNKKYNQNEKDEIVPHFTKVESESGTEYNTGSTLVPSTTQDQTTFNTNVPDQASTSGEIYDYTKPTQGTFFPLDKNRPHIDTPFGPQIIPIFQRVPPHLGQQTQQSNSNLQPNNQELNEKEIPMSHSVQAEAVTSSQYNTGSTPQDQSFNTQVTNQASTTGEVYEYTKPEQRLPSQSNKENTQFGQMIQEEQSGAQNQDGQPITSQSTQAPTTTIGVSRTESDSQNANTLTPQYVFIDQSVTEKKPLDSRPQISFHSACCKGLRVQNKHNSEPINRTHANTLNQNFGTNVFEHNKNIDQHEQNKNRGGSQASNLPPSQDFEPQRGSQTYAGVGEKFSGPRKPPHFDETGYHY